MSTAEGSTAAQTAQQTAATSRRNQVMVGELPGDFLRCRSQVQEDERIAHILQAQQQAGMTNIIPSNVVGRISITVVQAKLNKNYGLTKMDPYCRVRIGHTVFETPTAVNGAKNPRWNKTVTAFIPHGVDSLYLEIFDERSFTVDDRVAWGVIHLPQGVMNGDTTDEWYNLSGRLGDGMEGAVNLVMSLTPAASLPQMSYVTTYTTPPMMPMPMPMPMYGYPQPAMTMYPPPQMPAMPQQQVQPPQLSEEDMKMVKDMFPNMEDDVIKSVFEANRGNKDATINCLLSMTAD